MLNTLTFRGLLVLTTAIAMVTGFLTWIVIDFEPPAFVGFVFGAFSGALWMSIVIVAHDFWDGN